MARSPSWLCVLMMVLTSLAGCLASEASLDVSRQEDEKDDPTSAGAYEGDDPAYLTGVVVDPELVPVEGVVVSIEPGGFFDETDVVGAFKLGPLAEGTYDVTAAKDGYAPAALTTTLRRGETQSLNLVVKPMASTVPYHETLVKTMYLICAFSIRVAVTSGVGLQTTAPGAGLLDIALQTATGQPYTNTLDNWTFNFKIEQPGFRTLVMEMVWPPQQFGTNGLMQLSKLARAEGSTSGVTIAQTVYGGSMAQPYHDMIHAGKSYWRSGGKNVTFYPNANETESFQMLIAGYYGNTSVPLGGSALFINYRPTVYLSFFYNRHAAPDFTILPDR